MMSVLRQVEVKDYAPIIQVIDDWWGGRPMAGMLHRLFFEHFQPTSFVIEQHAEIVGFLVSNNPYSGIYPLFRRPSSQPGARHGPSPLRTLL